MPDTRHVSLAGKRVCVSPKTADRLWLAKSNPSADPLGAAIYAALIRAENEDRRRKQKERRQ